MRPGGGKEKGSSFERALCEMLSMWYSEGEYRDLCWRATTSGARGTVTRTRTKSFHGDICATSPLMEDVLSQFSIEAKHYTAVEVMEVVRPMQSMLLDFWKQSLKSAVMSKRIAVLIWKMNFRPEILCVPLKVGWALAPLMSRQLNYVALGNKVMMVNFKDALKHLDVKKFKRWVDAKEYRLYV